MPTNTQVARFIYTPVRVVVDETNNRFIFRETAAGPNLTAVMVVGEYTLAALGIEAKRAMEVAGASAYTVTYDPDPAVEKFTFTSDGSGGAGDFRLDVGAITDDALNVLFGFTSDKTGGLTYTSDVVRPSDVTFDTTTLMRQPQPVRRPIRGVHQADSGARRTTLRGTRELYPFFVEFESVAVGQGFYDFLRDAAEGGAAVTFIPDLTIPASKMTVYVNGDTLPIQEMTAQALYRLYVLRFDLEIKRPTEAADTITMRDLIDRGPTQP